jgi:predicted nucleotide-binding protein (sugar kinase/HSP70/actin superfamily)
MTLLYQGTLIHTTSLGKVTVSVLAGQILLAIDGHAHSDSVAPDARRIKSPFDISDVWASSYSSNTNEIMWGAKVAARCPWITCVIRLSSYECGMDQPTYTPTQKIVEGGGTLFFKFGDFDSTKPTGSIKIRVEAIVHYMAKYSQEIIQRKLGKLSSDCPLTAPSVPNPSASAELKGCPT